MPPLSDDKLDQWGIAESLPPPPPTLLRVLVVVAIGITIDRATSDWPLPVSWRAVAWWGVGLLALATWWPMLGRGREFAASICLLLSLACVAGAWHTTCWKAYAADEIGRLAPSQSEPCCLEIVAISHVERVASLPPSPYRAIPTGEKSQLEAHVMRVRNGQAWQSASGKCQILIGGHLLGVKPHDILRIYGQLQATQGATNPGEFDYRLYARADRQLCTIYCSSPECVQVIDRSPQWSPSSLAAHWNGKGQALLWNSLGPNIAPVACAVLLGADHAIPTERRTHYLVTGATHVLVVSGLHAGILVSSILLLLRTGLLPRRVSLIVAMLLIVAYTLLTGANPPVVRAAVAAEIICMGLLAGRRAISFNSLAAAALLVLALNPCELFLTGTQLSFLCTAALIWSASVFPQLANGSDQHEQESESWLLKSVCLAGHRIGLVLLTSGTLWLITLPLVTMHFHLFSPISVPASLLILPITWLAMVGGMMYLLLGGLFPWLEPGLAPVCGWLFQLLDGTVEWTSRWPMSHAWTPGPPGWWVAGYYIGLAMLLKPGGVRGGWMRLAQVLAIWIIVGVGSIAAERLKPRGLEVAFLDVGHGTSVVITTPQGATLIYDAGGLGSPRQATEVVSHYLWARGIRQIDGVILSHADVDHFNGLPGLLERFPIGRVFVSPHMFPLADDPNDNTAPAMLRRVLEDHHIPTEIVMMGDRLTIDSSTFAEVLYPDQLGNVEGDNANSLVIGLEHQGFRLLLPGDIEGFGMERVLADIPYDCHILLAPHHGSNRSDPPGFAAWSTPEWVVISGSPEFSDPAVAATYRQSGCEVFATGTQGAIIFRLQSGWLELPTSGRVILSPPDPKTHSRAIPTH